MALKFVIDKLEDVDAPLRAYYARVGEKYQLTTEGEHPKVTEFRSTNINQARELEELRPLKTKFEGVDPEEYRTLKAKAAAGDPADLVALRAELATEKAARAAAQARADALVLETTISDAFLKAGGLPKARGVIVAAAASQFTVEGGVLTSKRMSPDRPGEPMSVNEFMTLQTRENSFCFAASVGGGAVGNKGGGGAAGGAKELKNPTPQQLGEHAAAIKRGDVKVTYTT